MKQITVRFSLLLLCFIFTACSQQESLPQLSLEVTEAASTELAPSPTALFTEDHAQERLVVWGRSEGEPGGKCWVWLLDPASQGEPIRQISGKQDCNYAVVTVNEKEYLASLPQWNPNVAEQPAEIVLYDVTRDGELVVYQTIPMGDVHLTSLMNTPQWGADGSVYLAGILDGKEQIFRYDSQTAAIEPYLDRDDGFSTSPLLSPDGRYLAYLVVENNESSQLCDRRDCSRRYYHIRDLDTGQDVELLPVIEPWLAGEPYFMHCDLDWSSTSKFVAFSVGCGLQEPSSVTIIDVKNGRLVEVINAQTISSHIRQYEWLSDDRLVVLGDVTFALSNEQYDGYLFYLAAEQSWQSLANLPQRNFHNNAQVAFGDWTEDGALAVGHSQVPGEKRRVELAIFAVENESSDGLYVQTPDEHVDQPIWSASGSFIAYRSDNWETQASLSRFTIIERTGETLLDTGMLEVVSPHFAWLLQP